MNATAEHHEGPHVSPLSTYFVTYGSLLVLTILTVGVSRLDLGSMGIYPAMGIAVIKASLVIGWFMHVRYDGGFINVILFVSIFFIIIFFSWTMADLGGRSMLVPEHGNAYYREINNLVVDAPTELSEEGHKMPAAYINEESLEKHGGSHGEEGHDAEGEQGGAEGEGGH